MKVLVLNSNELEALLDHDGLRNAMKLGMQSLSVGEAQSFPRYVASIWEGALGFMAAANSREKLLGYKAVSVFHKNTDQFLNPHQGLVALLDFETGVLRALLDGMTVTALRTAAVSAAATDLLSVKDARHLALIGSGRQAYEHARAIVKIRPIRRISIWGRSSEKVERLIQSLRREFSGQIESVASPDEAATSADIVVSATASSIPLLSTSILKAGSHLNAIGASRPGSCEVDLQSRPGLKIYLDSRAACEVEAEEISSALQKGSLNGVDICGEVGEAFSGKIPGRRSEKEITVFKSVGLGIQDLMAADFFYERAVVLQAGQCMEL